MGISFKYDNGQLVVASVEYGSAAQIGGISSGAVVEWLDGTYVLGLSDQAKRDLARSQAPWTQIATASPDQAAADLATFERLVAVARGSNVAWISNPERNRWPACYVDGSCLPAESLYVYTKMTDAVCIPTDGHQLFTILDPTLSAPAAQDGSIGALCVSASLPSAGGSFYGYMSSGSVYYWWWVSGCR
jgi:hypothetical protein